MGNFIATFMTTDDAVKPGHLVTQIDHSQKVVAWADAADDIVTGVVGCSPSNDVDTAYPIGSSVPVYQTGSLATVWVRYKTNGGALVAGSPVMSTAGTSIDGLAVVGADSANFLFEQLGRATHWHDNIASESWVKVKLG